MRDYWIVARPILASLFVAGLLLIVCVWFVRRYFGRWQQLSSVALSPRFWLGFIVFFGAATFLFPIYRGLPVTWANGDTETRVFLIYILFWPMAWIFATFVWFRQHCSTFAAKSYQDDARSI